MIAVKARCVGLTATSVCLEVLLYCKPLSRLEGHHSAFNLQASRSETERGCFLEHTISFVTVKRYRWPMCSDANFKPKELDAGVSGSGINLLNLQ